MKKSTPKKKPSLLVMTIGHSTRPLEEFIGLLKARGATGVVDVRTVPRSRHNPQFNKTSLPRSLKKAGLGYVHMPGLGGLRHAERDSPNMGWRNASFRGYADYMQTPEFAQSLEELICLANQGSGAVALSSLAHRRCLVGSWNPHRGHHECNSQSGSYSHALCQSPGHRDHISTRGFRQHAREGVGQTGSVSIRTSKQVWPSSLW
jgi:hypothetical protein